MRKSRVHSRQTGLRGGYCLIWILLLLLFCVAAYMLVKTLVPEKKLRCVNTIFLDDPQQDGFSLLSGEGQNLKSGTLDYSSELSILARSDFFIRSGAADP